MIGLRTWLRRRAARVGRWPVLIVAGLLVTRLIAQPVALPAGEAGTIALCLGGKIVHVRLGLDGPEPPDPPAAERCDWFGCAPGIDRPEPAALPGPAPAPALRRSTAARHASRPAPRMGYCARGPPHAA